MKKVNPFIRQFGKARSDQYIARLSDINQIYNDDFDYINERHNDIELKLTKNAEPKDKPAIYYLIMVSRAVSGYSNNYQNEMHINAFKSVKPNIDLTSDYVKAAYILITKSIIEVIGNGDQEPAMIPTIITFIETLTGTTLSQHTIGNSVIEDVVICDIINTYLGFISQSPEFIDVFSTIIDAIKPISNITNTEVQLSRMEVVKNSIGYIISQAEIGQYIIDLIKEKLNTFPVTFNQELLNARSIVAVNIFGLDAEPSQFFLPVIFQELLNITLPEIEVQN